MLKANPLSYALAGISLAIVSGSPVLAEENDRFTANALDQNQVDQTLLDQIEVYNQNSSLSQVRSVNQLSDVRPTDWAYQALRSLVERYGCIAGYPDATFRGNRAMTRYEFAAGLNACLDTVNELIASATADLASQEDLLVLQRLQEEFQAELATLRGRVDSLEARTAELEANQFSTTTKLSGQAILGFSSVLSGDDVNGNDAPGNAVFSDRLRLGLETSFTGEDLLYARLATGNTANLLSDTTTEGSPRTLRGRCE